MGRCLQRDIKINSKFDGTNENEDEAREKEAAKHNTSIRRTRRSQRWKEPWKTVKRMGATGDERVGRRSVEEEKATTASALRNCRQKQAQVFALRTPGT